MKHFLFLAVLSIMQISAFATSPIVASIESKDCSMKIGDTYAGGIVFYMDSASCHGLVCAPYDQSKDADWAGAGVLSKSLGIGGYSDWRLPSMSELKDMYNNLHHAGLGNFAKGYYWSSDESRQYYAWNVNFTTGIQYCSGKKSPGYVRVVRAF
jgi:hypothetical protein